MTVEDIRKGILRVLIPSWARMEHEIARLEFKNAELVGMLRRKELDQLENTCAILNENRTLKDDLQAALDREKILMKEVSMVREQDKPSEREKKLLKQVAAMRDIERKCLLAIGKRDELQTTVAELTTTNARLVKALAEVTAPKTFGGDKG